MTNLYAVGNAKGSGKMIYRVTTEISETELKNLYNYSKIVPIYKDEPDEDDIYFIQENFNVGIECETLYEKYCSHFKNELILKKYSFYDLVRQLTDTETKVGRIPGDCSKYRFL